MDFVRNPPVKSKRVTRGNTPILPNYPPAKSSRIAKPPGQHARGNTLALPDPPLAEPSRPVPPIQPPVRRTRSNTPAVDDPLPIAPTAKPTKKKSHIATTSVKMLV